MSQETLTTEIAYRLIPAGSVKDLEVRVAKVNARAHKQGLSGGWTLRIGETRWVPISQLEFDIYGDAAPKTQKTEVAVTGEAPSYGGWTFLATITNDEGALIIRNAPGVEGIDRDAVRPGECDHCNKTRNRNNTYIVEKDGQRRQVGSSCVKDFLGHSVILTAMFAIDPLSEFDEEMMSRVNTAENAWNVRHVLATAIEIIDECGFVRSHEIGATADKVTKALRDMVPAQSEALIKAETLMTWILDQPASDYMSNLQALVNAGAVSKRNIGLAASAPWAMFRATELEGLKAKQADDKAKSQWVGKEKDKLEIDVEIVSTRFIDNDWGGKWLYTMVDDQGNVFKWFASNAQGFLEGDKVCIKGTVKGHEEYHELKSTFLTRCKQVEHIQGENGQWTCSNCRDANKADAKVCERCGDI